MKRRIVLVALLGLALMSVAAAVVYLDAPDERPDVAASEPDSNDASAADPEPGSCSSCDARHQRLNDGDTRND